jgi:hypothetical protein
MPKRQGEIAYRTTVTDRIKVSHLVNILQRNGLGQLRKSVRDPVTGKRRKVPYFLEDSQVRSAIFLIDRVLPRATAPQDVNLLGNVTVVFDDPTQRPAGYKRRPALKSNAGG